MPTFFPLSPSVGDTYSGYEWDGVSWNVIGLDLTVDYTTDAELATHNSDTTNVHGIADTSVLATQTYVDTAESDAVSTANAYSDSLATNYDAAGSAATAESNANSYTDTEISTHNSTTLSVHGIADTSALATKTYADNAAATAAANVVNGSPAALDTLIELSAALGDDPNFATTVANDIGLKAPIASPTFTGIPSAPTAATSTNTTQIATTEFVQQEIAPFEALPSKTGNAGKYLTTDGSTTSWDTVTVGYVQSTEPTSPQESQMWLDTDGTVAYDSAYPTVIYSPTEPTGLSAIDAGTVWTNGDDNNLSIWDGSAWVNAIVTFTYAATQPSNPITGQVWVDSSNNASYVYNGTSFVSLIKPVSYQASAPSSANTGDLWVDSDNDVLYIWDGSSWKNTDANITSQLNSEVSTLQNTITSVEALALLGL